MTLEELTKRVEVLEAALAELRAKQVPTTNGQRPWWEAEVGRFANDPVFDEVVRLGREYRESQHPDKMKKPRARRRGNS